MLIHACTYVQYTRTQIDACTHRYVYDQERAGVYRHSLILTNTPHILYQVKTLGKALAKGSTELSFDAIFNPPRLEDTAPAHERLADSMVYKLNSEGEFQSRRLFITKRGTILICASNRGVDQEGTFTKRSQNYLNMKGYLVTYNERNFVLADGTLKYWNSK